MFVRRAAADLLPLQTNTRTPPRRHRLRIPHKARGGSGVISGFYAAWANRAAGAGAHAAVPLGTAGSLRKRIHQRVHGPRIIPQVQLSRRRRRGVEDPPMMEVNSRRLHTSPCNLCLVAEHGDKAHRGGGLYIRQVVAARRHKNHPALSSCSLVKDSYATIPALSPKGAPGRQARKQTWRLRRAGVHTGRQ